MYLKEMIEKRLVMLRRFETDIMNQIALFEQDIVALTSDLEEFENEREELEEALRRLVEVGKLEEVHADKSL